MSYITLLLGVYIQLLKPNKCGKSTMGSIQYVSHWSKFDHVLDFDMVELSMDSTQQFENIIPHISCYNIFFIYGNQGCTNH